MLVVLNDGTINLVKSRIEPQDYVLARTHQAVRFSCSPLSNPKQPPYAEYGVLDTAYFREVGGKRGATQQDEYKNVTRTKSQTQHGAAPIRYSMQR